MSINAMDRRFTLNFCASSPFSARVYHEPSGLVDCDNPARSISLRLPRCVHQGGASQETKSIRNQSRVAHGAISLSSAKRGACVELSLPSAHICDHSPRQPAQTVRNIWSPTRVITPSLFFTLPRDSLVPGRASLLRWSHRRFILPRNLAEGSVHPNTREPGAALAARAQAGEIRHASAAPGGPVRRSRWPASAALCPTRFRLDSA